MIFADTHVLVWLATGDERLPDRFRRRIAEGEPLSTSIVVACEYVELHERGRFGQGVPFAHMLDLLGLRLEAFPVDAWPVIERLPAVHRDPVGRMLIAHTLVAGGTLATADKNMRSYPVPLAW